MDIFGYLVLEYLDTGYLAFGFDYSLVHLRLFGHLDIWNYSFGIFWSRLDYIPGYFVYLDLHWYFGHLYCLDFPSAYSFSDCVDLLTSDTWIFG